MDTEAIRREFDKFLEENSCDMTDKYIIAKALETEEKLFGRTA